MTNTLGHSWSDATPWFAIGSPLDCSATGRGEERAPDALRCAGLLERIGARDLGDAHGFIDDHRRDPVTGILAYDQIVRANVAVRDTVSGAFRRHGRPLMLGGDCSFLPGALAGARAHHDRVGLVFIDGHLDSYDGASSPTGEAADMDLAIATGRGDSVLIGLAGAVPIVAAHDVFAVGCRATDPDGFSELDLADPATDITVDYEVRNRGGAVGQELRQRLGDEPGCFWVHFDVDVFDPAEMASYTYLQPGGIGWEDAFTLLATLVASPFLVGMSVADFVPALDPDGSAVRRLVDLLVDVLQSINGHP